MKNNMNDFSSPDNEYKKSASETDLFIKSVTLQTFIILPGIPLAFLILFRIFRRNKELMNWIIDHITNPYKQFISGLADHLPFSLAELVIAAVFIWILFYIIRSVVMLIRGPRRFRLLLGRLMVLFSAVLYIYSGYTLFWGLNFYGTGFTEKSGLQQRGATVQELYELTVAFIDKANDLSGEIDRDANGSFSVSTEDIFADSTDIYDGILEEYSFLDGEVRTPKAMLASSLMDLIGYTGVYFPFTAEANLNTNPPNCLLPATVAHELSHQRGVTDEDEANFVAIETCLKSGNPVYAYSGCLLAYIHVGNALYKADPELAAQARELLNVDVKTDINDNNAYWNALRESKVSSTAQKTADKIYTQFAESYGEENVMQRYGACVELLVAYYFD